MLFGLAKCDEKHVCKFALDPLHALAHYSRIVNAECSQCLVSAVTGVYMKRNSAGSIKGVRDSTNTVTEHLNKFDQLYATRPIRPQAL